MEAKGATIREGEGGGGKIGRGRGRNEGHEDRRRGMHGPPGPRARRAWLYAACSPSCPSSPVFAAGSGEKPPAKRHKKILEYQAWKIVFQYKQNILINISNKGASALIRASS